MEIRTFYEQKNVLWILNVVRSVWNVISFILNVQFICSCKIKPMVFTLYHIFFCLLFFELPFSGLIRMEWSMCLSFITNNTPIVHINFQTICVRIINNMGIYISMPFYIYRIKEMTTDKKVKKKNIPWRLWFCFVHRKVRWRWLLHQNKWRMKPIHVRFVSLFWDSHCDFFLSFLGKCIYFGLREFVQNMCVNTCYALNVHTFFWVIGNQVLMENKIETAILLTWAHWCQLRIEIRNYSTIDAYVTRVHLVSCSYFQWGSID